MTQKGMVLVHTKKTIDNSQSSKIKDEVLQKTPESTNSESGRKFVHTRSSSIPPKNENLPTYDTKTYDDTTIHSGETPYVVHNKRLTK
jgi:hypothetical protein